ncbi:MAG: type I-U CRISPR-associated protein Csx17, partial [Desulfomonilia bacterium]
KDEIEALFSEGRSSVGRRTSHYGVDFARAVASLGIDRGISAFQRFAIVKGRIGMDYNTSASFGRFEVRSRPGTDLLEETDRWLDSFRDAASKDDAPHRFRSALKRLESSIFDFCRYGGAPRLTDILRSFGNAERELAVTRGRVGQNKISVRPLFGLSQKWLQAADDRSTEFELARALSGIYDPEKNEPIRANIEPVSSNRWKDNDRCDVWDSAALPRNLLSILERRMLDAARKGCTRLPLASPSYASLNTVSKYIAGDVDDRKIEELLWSMAAISYRAPSERRVSQPLRDQPGHESRHIAVLPRQYAVLKLVFLPRPLKIGDEEISIRPETAITSLLRAGRTGEACVKAARRLRMSGLTPMSWRKWGGAFIEKDWSAGDVDPLRLGSALLFPVSPREIDVLGHMVLRTEKKPGAD